MILRDKIVIITGASKGLGRALSQAFTKEGSKLVMSARSDKEMRGFREEVGGLIVPADVSKEDDVRNLAEQAVKKFGQIDIWINNAGIRVPHGPIEKLDMKRVHEMIEVNLFGTIYGSKAALIQMKKQQSGVIINILSTSALDGRAFSSAYAASKYAAAGFTKSLQKESEHENILVIGVFPGGMKTNFFNEQMPEDFNNYMDPNYVAEKIIKNLKEPAPARELIIKRQDK